MQIAVLKEIKEDENRVALRPDQVHVLKDDGHTIFVEESAGAGSRFADEEYERAGAIICQKANALLHGELILKVKTPLPTEYMDYDKNHILFTYLHLDENIPAEQINRLISPGFMGIAYEWVGTQGNYPLLTPMSRLTGYLFAQKSAELCTLEKGIFFGGHESFLNAANVLIIGLGNIGISTAKYFIDNNSNITIVDKASDTEINNKLNARLGTGNIDYITRHKIRTVRFDPAAPHLARERVQRVIESMDIVLNCAVRREDCPKSKLDYLISADMIASMGPGSVVCDTTACDRDLIETCVSSPSLHHTYSVNGVVHYNCDHIPSIAPRTSTQILTDTTFGYVRLIANRGIGAALRSSESLRNGVSCLNGKITHRYTARKKNLPFLNIDHHYDLVDSF